MMLNDLNKFANLLILLLQVISEGLVVVKKFLVLFIESLELPRSFCKVHLLLLLLPVDGALELFLRTLIRLCHRLDLVTQCGHFLLFEFVHLFRQVKLLASDAELLLQFANLLLQLAYLLVLLVLARPALHLQSGHLILRQLRKLLKCQNFA